ncbi:MAG TPA: glycosyltransferase family 1 protein [Candidatus Dormibacteraeota bacterium]|nr:glycosyltransferase family 1 protein [Candidatus Dormibacteraeota bacterium]
MRADPAAVEPAGEERLTGLHVVADGSGLSRPLAGIGTYTVEILRALAAEGPGNRFTVYTSADVSLGHPALATRRPPTLRLVGRHLLWPARLRRLGADLYFGPAGQLPLGEVGMPAVLTAHDMAIYRHPEWFPGGQTLAVRVTVPRSMRRAAVVIAVSASTARDVAELFGLGPERLEVIPEGVAGRYRPLSPVRLEAARSRFRLPDRFILFVSTIEPRKNLDTLLEAWSRMPDRPPLVVAGGWGWRCEAVRARMERMGPDLVMLGPVPPGDLPGLYNLATCLAHPAWYEGFGLTPLEAMACGTPVVASRSSSLPEVVGEAGLLVDPEDVEGWTEALGRVCGDADLHATLRRRGLLRAAEFTWERAARRTWRVFERVVRAHRR